MGGGSWRADRTSDLWRRLNVCPWREGEFAYVRDARGGWVKVRLFGYHGEAYVEGYAFEVSLLCS